MKVEIKEEKKISNFWNLEGKLKEKVETAKDLPNKVGLMVGFIVALLVVAGTVSVADIFVHHDEEPNFFFGGGTVALILGCCLGTISRCLGKLYCNPFKTNAQTERYIKESLEELYINNKLNFSPEELQKYFDEGQQIIMENAAATVVVLNDQQVKLLIEKFSEATKKTNEHTPLLINP